MKKIFTFFAALVCAVSMFAAQETVYFVNAQKWTGTINAYAWTSSSNASWPGVAATKEAEQVAGFDVYSYSAEAGTYANVIFNDGSKQTADLKWTAGKYYVKDGWYTKEEAASKLGQPIEYESVYFVNVDNWANVKIYTWSPEIATWSGENMKKESEQIGDKDVWSYTVEKGTSFGGMLFNNGSGTQTGDLVWTPGKYYVKDGWYTKEEATAKLNAGTTPTPTAYYVVGTFNGWKNPDPTYAMTAEDNLYKKTFTLAAGMHMMKVTDGTWNDGCNWGYFDVTGRYQEVTEGTNDEGENNGNILINLTEEQTITVVFDSEEKKISFEGLTEAGPAILTYVLMGVAGDWNTGIALEQNPANEKEYMLICQTIAEGDAVKVVTLTNGGKTAYCGNVEEGSAQVDYDSDGNIILAPGSYDFYYKVEGDIIYVAKAACDTTVTPEDPEVGVTYYVTGNAALVGEQNAWSATAIAMTLSDTIYTHTFEGLSAGDTCKLKVTDGTWDKNWGFAAVDVVPGGVTNDADDNIVFVMATDGDVVVTFDGTNISIEGDFTQEEALEFYTVTYDVFVPAGTYACYIAGEMNGWTFTEMTKVEENHYMVNIDSSNIAMKYKYCSGPGWEYVEMQADGVTDIADRSYAAYDTVAAWASVYDPNASVLPDDTLGVYTIAGAVGLVGVDWDPTATINDMTKQEDGTYTLLKENLKLVADMPYEYKVVKNHAWDIWSLPSWNMGNDTLLVEKSGLYDVTFTLNLVDTILTAVAHLKEELVLVPVVQLAGNMTDWANNAITMQLASDSLTSFTTIPLLAASVYQIKVIVGGNWKGCEGVIDRENCTDILFDSEANCNLYADVAGDYTFTWTFATNTLSVDYPSITENPSDSVTPDPELGVYTIAGAVGLVGVDWDPTATINDMTKQEDGTYTLLKENLKLVADMPYEYKVVKNHAWDIWSLPGWNMGNDTLLVEKSGLYDVIFTLNLVDTILTAVAHLKEELVLVPVVQLAGNMTDWAENAIEMTLSTDSLSASTTISLLADSLYTFKVIVDGNWKGYNGMITRANSTDLVFNSEVNCGLLTDVAGEYTITWVFATSSVSVVYPENNIPLPEPKDIAVKAKMPSHWTETITAWVWETGKEGEVVIPTKDDDWYVVSARCSALNVIFRNGTDWDGDANQTVNITLMDSACIVLSQSDTTKATYTIVDCETSDPLPEPKGVTYSVTVPAGTNACYIAGEMNNWSHIEMTKVDDTHYTLTVDTATASMKYKYCSGPSWDYVEMQADGVSDVQDRTYSTNDVVESWKAVYDSNGSENPDPNPEPKDIMVKAKMPEGWTNTITAWVWATGENGTEVILTREGDWYVYTQNCTELNIIFKNGTGWNGDVNQTVDILLKESTCLQVIAGEGKATYTIVDCETTDIEGVHVSNNVTKFIQDGQLVILFDGVLYNVYGQVVK